RGRGPMCWSPARRCFRAAAMAMAAGSPPSAPPRRKRNRPTRGNAMLDKRDEAQMAVEGVESWPRVILFDLDGTLIDSAPDIMTAINRLLALKGLPVLTLDEVRAMIGHGVQMLVQRAFRYRGVELDGMPLVDMTTEFADIYAQHLVGETL